MKTWVNSSTTGGLKERVESWVGGSWQWKFGGKPCVGRKEKHMWTVLRGSVEGRVTRPPSARLLWTARWGLPVFNIKTPTKPTREGFKHLKIPRWETITTLLTEQTFLEFGHILLAEIDSGSVLGTGCFPHLVPLMEMSAQTPLFSWHIWFNTRGDVLLPPCGMVWQEIGNAYKVVFHYPIKVFNPVFLLS